MIGSVISHYEVLSEHGSGGMGVVYKARDLELDRLVALKFLPPELSRDEEANQRFKREARAASALDHPNICTIHDIVETDDGRLFIVMAFYEGQTLNDRLREYNVEPEEALDIARRIADGLQAAHDKGIVHRDIKPANVMITEEGQVKILDFGLAKLATGLTLTSAGGTPGTVYYMSPEQIRGEEVDQRSDLWSLGVVLYEMLTGTRPFSGDYDQAISYAILNADPELDVIADPFMRELVARCLARDRSSRFQDAGEFLSLLRSSLPVKPTSVSSRRLSRPVTTWATVLVLAAVVIGWLLTTDFTSSEPTEGTGGVPRIGVLSFENQGPLEDEFFAYGITDEINSRLSSVEGLDVISRKTARLFDGTDRSISEIGRELGVQYILEGTVRWASSGEEPSRVRITPALVRVSDDTQIWSQVYDRVIDDILRIQSDIANRVIEQTGVALGRDNDTPKPEPTSSVEAYMLYLKGRYFLERRTKNNREIALDFFEQAVEIDPTYALAWVGIADSWIFLGWYGVLAPEEAFPKAKQAAERALALDELLAEAHISRAHVYFEFDHDWGQAEREYRRGLELNPKYAIGHHWYARYLTAMGRLDEAREHLEKARARDPLSMIINTTVALRTYFARDYEAALDEYEMAMRIDPDFAPLQWHMGWALEQIGRYEDAIAAAQKAIDISGGNLVYVASLGHANAIAGNEAAAREILNRLEAESASRHVSAYQVAVIYGALGETETAFNWLNRAYQEQSPWIGFLRVDPRLDPLRGDPRFGALLERLNL